MDHIAHQIVFGVNWVVVFYALFALAILTWMSNVLKSSPHQIIVGVLREIRELFTHRNWTRENLNGFTVIALFVGFLFVALAPFMRELIGIFEFLLTGIDKPQQFSIYSVFLLVFIGIIGALSISYTRV